MEIERKKERKKEGRKEGRNNRKVHGGPGSGKSMAALPCAPPSIT
jgi:hypothetical protein